MKKDKRYKNTKNNFTERLIIMSKYIERIMFAAFVVACCVVFYAAYYITSDFVSIHKIFYGVLK